MILSSLNEVRSLSTEEKTMSFGAIPSRLLIVDDDHSSVLSVYDMATFFNARVDAANGVEAAVDCLKESRYDAVIADFGMNGSGGYELACWIRDRSPDTRIVIMSRRNHTEVERYMNTGIVDYWIFKPFGINELLLALDDFVPKGLADLPKAG